MLVGAAALAVVALAGVWRVGQSPSDARGGSAGGGEVALPDAADDETDTPGAPGDQPSTPGPEVEAEVECLEVDPCVRWRADLDPLPASRVDDVVALASDDEVAVAAYDRVAAYEHGTHRWTATGVAEAGDAVARLAHRDGLVVAVTRQARVVAMDALTGEVRWRRALLDEDDDPSGSRAVVVSVTDARVVIQRQEQRAGGASQVSARTWALAREGGEVAWERGSASAPLFATARLLDAGTDLVLALERDELRAYEPEHGTIRWRLALEHGIARPVAADDSWIALHSGSMREAGAVLVDPQTGEVVHEVPGLVHSAREGLLAVERSWPDEDVDRPPAIDAVTWIGPDGPTDRVELDEPDRTLLAPAEQAVIVRGRDGGDVERITSDGQRTRLDLSAGTDGDPIPLPSGPLVVPVDAAHMAVDPTDGRRLWRVESDRSIIHQLLGLASSWRAPHLVTTDEVVRLDAG